VKKLAGGMPSRFKIHCSLVAVQHNPLPKPIISRFSLPDSRRRLINLIEMRKHEPIEVSLA
jgi:hypothetical protein